MSGGSEHSGREISRRNFTRDAVLAGIVLILAAVVVAGCALPLTYTVPTLVYPTYFTSTPLPTATPLPSPTQTPTPLVAAGIGTPVAPSRQVISVENSAQLARFAQWGHGIPRQAAWSSDEKLIAVAATHGIYLFDGQSLAVASSFEDGSAWRSVAFSPDSRLLAAGNENGEIYIWDAQDLTTGIFASKPLNIFRNHRLPVYNLSFSPDSSLLASSGWDSRILIWQVSSDKIFASDPLVLALDDFQQPVLNLAFSAGNTLLYTWLAKGSVQTWSLLDGKRGRDFYLPQHYALNSSSAAIDSAASAIAINYGTTIRIMRLRDGITLNVLSKFKTPVQELFLTPGGERLVTVEGADIKIWQVGDGTLVGELAPPEETASLSHGALSPDGQRLVTLGDALRVWRISGEPVLLKTVQAGFVSDYPIAMGFSADGGSLLAALMDGSLLTYRLDDGALLPPVPVGEPPLSSLALAARQSLAAVGRGDKQIDLVKPDGNLILNLSKEKSPATSLALSPDGSMFSSATADNAVLVRRTSDGATVQTLKPVEGTSQMVFSPDGSLLALRAKNGISLWMLENGSQMVVIPGYTLSFSADGGLLATSFAEEGRELTRIRKIQDGLTLSTIKTGGTDLSFSPDGQLLAISGPTLTLWNVADGSQLAGPPELENRFSPFSRLAFSPDGRLLAQLSPDGVLSLWGVP